MIGQRSWVRLNIAGGYYFHQNDFFTMVCIFEFHCFIKFKRRSYSVQVVGGSGTFWGIKGIKSEELGPVYGRDFDRSMSRARV